ncbi:MAG: TonB-dependent receptor plug domain-containing protein, partial [Proteobacteria bacterium]|nr:TonB-dependent receptor plug domain-containing protein [Pseudomonadota bacterium]
MNRLRYSAVLLGATLGFAAAAQAAATAQTEQSESQLLSEIVVTAQKRSQSLLDVPLSVSVISGDELTKRGASTIEDLQFTVPGLSITEFSPGQQRISMRGISVYSGLPTVGVYMDEMPLNLETNQTGQDVRMVDIERVEVLRGPQGTLYGQGAVGGTIRYITNPVDLTRFSASAGADFGAVSGGGTDWRTDG